MSVVRRIEVPELGSVTSLNWINATKTANDTTITTVLKGKADRGDLINDDILTSLRESEVGIYGFYGGHKIDYGYGKYDNIEITCVDLNVTLNSSGYYSRFEASARTESRPLEEKLTQIATTGDVDETYLTWWNHRVISTNEAESITEADWKAQTDTKNPSAYAGTTARWAKTSQALKKGEFTIMEARFPGVQSYGVGAEQVKELVYSRSLSVVLNIISAVGSKKAPKDSSNAFYDTARTDDTQWLITSASYVKRFGWYEAQLTYAYAKGGWLDRDNPASKTGVYPLFTSL